MPSLKELYKRLDDVRIDADSINVNTDGLESLLATTQADIALIKTDLANGVLSDVRDGSGNAITSSARGSQRALSVQIVDGSGGQITSFGSSSVSVSNFPATQPVSGTFWQTTQPVSGSVSVSNFPATQAISGTVTANTGLSQPLTDSQLRATAVPVSGTVNTYPQQGSGTSNSNFTGTNPSTSLATASSSRKVLTVFNEGAGTLYINAGGCTTTSYQVRLAAGDYWECPDAQVSLAHTAVFATAGTARVTQVS
jgi:hypothetical protein